MAVVNTKGHEFDPDRDVYIGRSGHWGNPFVIGKDGSRSVVIEKYRRYLWKQIEKGSISLNELAYLDGKNLVCHCAPRPCHGDVLERAAKWAKAKIETF